MPSPPMLTHCTAGACTHVADELTFQHPRACTRRWRRSTCWRAWTACRRSSSSSGQRRWRRPEQRRQRNPQQPEHQQVAAPTARRSASCRRWAPPRPGSGGARGEAEAPPKHGRVRSLAGICSCLAQAGDASNWARQRLLAFTCLLRSGQLQRRLRRPGPTPDGRHRLMIVSTTACTLCYRERLDNGACCLERGTCTALLPQEKNMNGTADTRSRHCQQHGF